MIAEGVLVVQRMLASRFTPNSLLGVDRRLTELSADLEGVDVPFYRSTADVMAQVVGFHLNRGVLAAAHRPPALDVEDVLRDARTVAVLEGVNDHENIGSMFRNAAVSVSTPSCSALRWRTRCTGGRCACRWGTRYGFRSRRSRSGRAD